MRKIKGMTFYDKPWYNSYRSMMDRCYREKAHNYPQYGGRGIRVCDEWHYIDVFAEWVERSGYQEGLTLDRIDPNGDYTPENCRWATRKQQANNRRNTVYVTIDGVTKTLSEWADFAGISRSTMSDRYFCKGIRGVMLLHRTEDTRFQKGYNRYGDSKHYDDYAPTIIPASGNYNEGDTDAKLLTNQVAMTRLSPEEFYNKMDWLLHRYGTQFNSTRLAVINWLKQEVE